MTSSKWCICNRLSHPFCARMGKCSVVRQNMFLTTSCLSVICSTSTSSSIKPLYSILLADSWRALEYTAWRGTTAACQVHSLQSRPLTAHWPCGLGSRPMCSPSIEMACSRACTAWSLFLWLEKPWASRMCVKSSVCLSFGMLYITVSDSMISDGLSEIWNKQWSQSMAMWMKTRLSCIIFMKDAYKVDKCLTLSSCSMWI